MYTGTRVIISNPGSVFDGKTGRTTYKNARKNGGIEVVFDEPLVASGMSFKTCYFGRKELVELDMGVGTKVVVVQGDSCFQGMFGTIESTPKGKSELYKVVFDNPLTSDGTSITYSFFTKYELRERDVTIQNQKF